MKGEYPVGVRFSWDISGALFFFLRVKPPPGARQSGGVQQSSSPALARRDAEVLRWLERLGEEFTFGAQEETPSGERAEGGEGWEEGLWGVGLRGGLFV